MSLRDKAITHIVDGLCAAVGTPSVSANHPTYLRHEREAEYALDALLLFLTEHTEEWEEAADVEVESSVRLVAALRGTTE